MIQLNNKVALITGASSGIGYVTAKLFAEHGAKVVVTARRQAELNELVQTIINNGGEAVALAGNVCDEQHAKALVDLAEAEFGGLDVALNNVGTLGPMNQLIDVAPDDWRATLETNLTSSFIAAKYQIPAMQRANGGSLIFTSTFVGHTAGFPQLGAYAASKAGLLGLVQTLAVEHGEDNIRVNALMPGATDTAMFRHHNPEPDAQNFIANLTALRRVARPEEIAQSALYLAAAASFTTGTALLVDGGVSINRT